MNTLESVLVSGSTVQRCGVPGHCQFVERRDNVLIIGQAGVGKSHLAQALGQRACRAGYNALYVAANDMLTQLRASRADQSYERRLLRFTSPELPSSWSSTIWG